jgi:hypothetical protein
MNRISDNLKIDHAITPQSLNGAGTSQYFPMDKYRRGLFTVNVGAMAAAATSAMQVMQATNDAAGGAKVVTSLAATITANTKVAAATLTLATVLAADVVTINGLTFTAAAAADLPNRVFAQAGDDTADAASLILAINHATAGVPGIKATSALGVVTLVASEPGEKAITIADASATITPATTKAVGFVEVEAGMLDSANGFSHLALRVTNSAAILTSASLLRDCRDTPTQYVAASDVAI